MDVSTHREGLIEPADRGSKRDIVDMYMRLDTSVKGVVRWHQQGGRTVSALGAMIVKVPVLAASGVAGVTVTVVSE